MTEEYVEQHSKKVFQMNHNNESVDDVVVEISVSIVQRFFGPIKYVILMKGNIPIFKCNHYVQNIHVIHCLSLHRKNKIQKQLYR